MTNIFQLTDSLFGVEVPNDAEEIQLFDGVTGTIYISYEVGSGTEDFDKLRIESLPNGDWDIIGICSNDSIDFDCEPYVKVFSITRLSMFGYMDYTKTSDEQTNYTCKTKEDSFRSLIESKSGKTFTNPLVEKPERMTPFMHAGHYTDNQKYKIEKYQKELQAWQQAQDNLLKKVVIIQKIK